jgi:hypothetical protein
MGTITITASGFSNLGAQPVNWPTTVTYPTSGSPNGTKTYTINDADWLSLLTWTAASQSSVQGTTLAPSTPTASAILLAWLQIWINGTETAVQQFETPAVVVPAQITIS